MVPRKVGWHFIDQPLPQPGVEGVHVLAMTPRLPDGSLLVVGEDMERSEAIRDAVFGAILTAGGIALVFGIIAGLFATRQTLRQMKRINVTVRAVERGDLRSEEHTSELHSLMRSSYAVLCFKKKIKQHLTQ